MLTDAALEGKRDKLVGLKENVIIGKLIPAATGLRHYRSLEIEPVEPAQRPEEDLLDEDELAAELGLAEDGDYERRQRRGLRPLVRRGARGARSGDRDRNAGDRGLSLTRTTNSARRPGLAPRPFCVSRAAFGTFCAPRVRRLQRGWGSCPRRGDPVTTVVTQSPRLAIGRVAQRQWGVALVAAAESTSATGTDGGLAPRHSRVPGAPVPRRLRGGPRAAAHRRPPPRRPLHAGERLSAEPHHRGLVVAADRRDADHDPHRNAEPAIRRRGLKIHRPRQIEAVRERGLSRSRRSRERSSTSQHAKPRPSPPEPWPKRTTATSSTSPSLTAQIRPGQPGGRALRQSARRTTSRSSPPPISELEIRLPPPGRESRPAESRESNVYVEGLKVDALWR